MNKDNWVRSSFRMTSFVVAAITLGILVVVGCSSSSSNPKNNPQPTKYDGTFTVAGGANGTVLLTITPPAAAMQPAIMPLAVTTDTVTGSLQLVGGAMVDLTGTFTAPSGPLSASGGGYTLTGTISNGVLGGTITGPGGSGTFTSLVSGKGGTVVLYCGTFAATGGSFSGTWNMAQSGTTFTGSWTGSNGTGQTNSGTLTGTLNGTTISLTSSDGGTATGTVNGTSASGTFTGADGTPGTWSGSTGSCS